MTQDRTYWHTQYTDNAWHAVREVADGRWVTGYCGRSNYLTDGLDTETADRIPPTAHLCGNCARIIAARTDVEQ